MDPPALPRPTGCSVPAAACSWSTTTAATTSPAFAGADAPEYTTWSRRDGPFLRDGFRIHVVHCFWTFDSLDDARSLLHDAFGPAGDELALRLRRPRLAWNVAVYHRGRAA